MQQSPNIKEIGPHKKYYNTDCPGINFPLDNMINSAFGSNTTVIAPAQSQPSNLIKLWDSGAAAKAIQEKLIKLGYDLGQ